MTRPRLSREADLLPGLAAVALFGVLALAFLNVNLGEAAGFGGDAALVRSIGAALFNIDPAAVAGEGTAVAGEAFLVPFVILAVLLDAALDGSLMLAKRDDEVARTDGGDEVARADGGSPHEHGGER